ELDGDRLLKFAECTHRCRRKRSPPLFRPVVAMLCMPQPEGNLKHCNDNTNRNQWTLCSSFDTAENDGDHCKSRRKRQKPTDRSEMHDALLEWDEPPADGCPFERAHPRERCKALARLDGPRRQR